MKKEINPLAGIAAIVVLIAVVSFLIYRGASSGGVGSEQDMSPEVREKVLKARSMGPPPGIGGANTPAR